MLSRGCSAPTQRWFCRPRCEATGLAAFGRGSNLIWDAEGRNSHVNEAANGLADLCSPCPKVFGKFVCRSRFSACSIELNESVLHQLLLLP